MTWEWEGYVFNLTRVKRRGVTIKFQIDGAFKILAPLQLSERSLQKIVQEKKEWLERCLAAGRGKGFPQKEGDTVAVLGKLYTVCVSEEAQTVRLDTEKRLLLVPSGKNLSVSQSVKAYFGNLVTERVREKLPAWERKAGLASAGFAVKFWYGKWGLCNVVTGKLAFNLLLAQYPEECLEFIIAHEVAHFKSRYHDQTFYTLLSALYPDWKAAKKRLSMSFQ